MKNVQKHFLKGIILLIWFLIFFSAQGADSYVYQNFDALPAATENEIPGSGGGWMYTSNRTNSREDVKNSGWYNTVPYSNNSKLYDFFRYYRNTYNNPHMGFETYGFLEIDGNTATKGNSLRITVTGGRNAHGESGLPLVCKEEYLDILKKQGTQKKGASKIGHPYVYFGNNSSSEKPTPFPYASGCNRLSLYVRMPDELDNGPGGKGKGPQQTIHIGPFNGTGGHWYHQFYNQGGGWTHLLIDGHPQHNNAWHNQSTYPYHSMSLRDMDIEYFSTMYRWYITFLPYSGIAIPPYSIWLDEIEFFNDPEPQNNETINSPAVTFHPETKLFEIGFNDKYKGNANSKSTYEVRYSFSPITNQNFDQAQPVFIQHDSRYGIAENPKGIFNKWWPYYQAVWAQFLLKFQDEQRLDPGARIFFAVKDLSDRPYNLGTFDREGDTAMVAGIPGKRRIDLIKRIDFIIDKNQPMTAHKAVKKPGPVKGLKID